MKKSKRIKKKNGIAKALQHPSFKSQVIPNKKKHAYSDIRINVQRNSMGETES